MVTSLGSALGAAAARRLAAFGESHTEIGPGLSRAELDRIERDYGFEFADDHRAFLSAGLPFNPAPRVSVEGVYYAWEKPWPDWRNGDPVQLRERIAWPVQSMLFDVEHDALWHPSWGQRPADISEAVASARAHLDQAPKLVPVYAHRYLPAGHGTCCHPVLSVWQSDIIVYGTDLDNYIQHEFGPSGQRLSSDWKQHPLVPFWSDYL